MKHLKSPSRQDLSIQMASLISSAQSKISPTARKSGSSVTSLGLYRVDVPAKHKSGRYGSPRTEISLIRSPKAQQANQSRFDASSTSAFDSSSSFYQVSERASKQKPRVKQTTLFSKSPNQTDI